MTRNVVRLPVVPLAEPVQLVLGLPVGIRTRKPRRRPLVLPAPRPTEQAA